MSQSQEDDELCDWVAARAHDPLGFVRGAFDWGGGDLAAHDGPDEWQTEILTLIGTNTVSIPDALRIAIASGHGIGKTALLVWIILWAMSTRPNLAGVVTANTGVQLETKTWRELAIWHKRMINAHWFAWTATKFYQVDHPETWFVSAIPWRKERSEAFAGLHSEHVLVVYDEASAIDDVIWEVTEGAMTTPKAMWFAFGNPTRNTGRFRECFGRFRHRWITRQIDSRSAKMANRVLLDQWIADYGEDSDFVRIRVKGVFPRAGSTQFISSEVVEGAMQREPIPLLSDPVLLGVDVARFGDDQTVIVVRRGRDARTWGTVKLRGADTMQTAARVLAMANELRADAIFVDGGGVGGGVVDRLRQMRAPNVFDVQFGAKADLVNYTGEGAAYANKRAEMWGNMREWLKVGAIADDRELAADLTGVEYGFNERNEIVLEKKEHMKARGLASPDVADALALTFAYPVMPTPARHGGQPAGLQSEWNPLATA